MIWWWKKESSSKAKQLKWWPCINAFRRGKKSKRSKDYCILKGDNNIIDRFLGGFALLKLYICFVSSTIFPRRVLTLSFVLFSSITFYFSFFLSFFFLYSPSLYSHPTPDFLPPYFLSLSPSSSSIHSLSLSHPPFISLLSISPSFLSHLSINPFLFPLSLSLPLPYFPSLLSSAYVLFHRLLQRYQNVKAELEAQQNLERIRLEKQTRL